MTRGNQRSSKAGSQVEKRKEALPQVGKTTSREQGYEKEERKSKESENNERKTKAKIREEERKRE